jgi:hypothetical protein
MSKAITPQPSKDRMDSIYLVQLHNLPWKRLKSPQYGCTIYLGRDLHGLLNATAHFSNDGIDTTSP